MTQWCVNKDTALSLAFQVSINGGKSSDHRSQRRQKSRNFYPEHCAFRAAAERPARERAPSTAGEPSSARAAAACSSRRLTAATQRRPTRSSRTASGRDASQSNRPARSAPSRSKSSCAASETWDETRDGRERVRPARQTRRSALAGHGAQAIAAAVNRQRRIAPNVRTVTRLPTR